MSENIFGFFDDPSQTKPAFDPSLSAPCPCCTVVLSGKPLKTISLMVPGDHRSFFFRVHKQCWESADEDERIHIESLLVDNRP